MASFKDFVKQRRAGAGNPKHAIASSPAAPPPPPAPKRPPSDAGSGAAQLTPGQRTLAEASERGKALLQWTPAAFEPAVVVDAAPRTQKRTAPRTGESCFFAEAAAAARDARAKRWRCLHSGCRCDAFDCGPTPGTHWWARKCARCGHARECHVSDLPMASTTASEADPSKRPRVLLVCHEVYFKDAVCASGAERATTADFGDVPTGALFVSWALILYLSHRFELTIVATDGDRRGHDVDDREPSVLHADSDAYAPSSATPAKLRALRGGQDAVRAAVDHWRGCFDAVFASDICADTTGPALLAGCPRAYAMVNTYSELPYGPFFAEKQTTKRREYLEKLELLCPSAALANYCRRHGRGALRASCVYYADYDYYAPTPPKPPDDVPPKPRFDVLVVSACGPKGLAVLLPIFRALPKYTFACVATKWMDPSTRFCLRAEPNVAVVAATPNRAGLYALARVLLAPSLWPEAYGIVATEAGLYGLPCVSSDSGGLPEANPVPSLAAKTRIVHDMLRSEIRHGTSLGDEEDDWAAAATDWPDVNDVDPQRPPARWAWKANAKRRGAGHDYDVHDALQAALAFGTFSGPTAAAAEKFLRVAELKRTLGTLQAGEKAFETQLAAFLDGSFRAAYDRGVADVSRLFAVATEDEARPFLDKLAPLLEDAAHYAAMRRQAIDGARAHVRDRAGKLDGLVS